MTSDTDILLPLLDHTRLAEAAELLEEDFLPLLRRFGADATRARLQIEEAAASRDWQTIARIAHTLKSSCRQLGLLRAGMAAAWLEESAVDGECCCLAFLTALDEGVYALAGAYPEAFR
jgi:HPt (histidine-containing phosphotransfer) domain-containing protein